MSNNGSLFSDLHDQRAPISVLQAGLDPVWTEHKAQLIANYLRFFVFITHHGAYIDGFAGPKRADKPGSWAAELVVQSEPRRLREVFLCDIDTVGVSALNALVHKQPDAEKRHYQVLKGDFNQTVDEILASGLIREKTATFCLLDQFSTECEWSTLQKLAAHKPAPARKIELFYFVGTGWIGRALAAFKDPIPPQKWWGRSDWQSLRNTAGDMIAVKIAERFRDELGYTYVHPYPIYQRPKGKGKVMIHMIHASDHPAAVDLMRRAHRSVTAAPETEEQLSLALAHLVEPATTA